MQSVWFSPPLSYHQGFKSFGAGCAGKMRPPTLIQEGDLRTTPSQIARGSKI